jgi:hypothetical protein
MGKPLNEFSGRSTEALRRELARLNDLWDSMTDEDGHGGSPREWLAERIDDLSKEIAERAAHTEAE